MAQLLSVRNAIYAATLLLVIAVASSLIGMLQTPDSGGKGHDSYGTRRLGYRGLFETLTELGVSTERDFAPPSSEAPTDDTLVILGPAPKLVGHEPRYLTSLLDWVERGGRLVVAPRGKDFIPLSGENPDLPAVPTLLETLDLTELNLTSISPTGQAGTSMHTVWRRPTDLEGVFEEFESEPTPPVSVPVKVTGSFTNSLPPITELNVPGESVVVLTVADDFQTAGAIRWKPEEGTEHPLAVTVKRGRGEIVVISDPKLFANSLLQGADNGVLAVSLLSPNGNPVRFDEFYHGLGVRGSPLYLLTRVRYAAIVIGFLLLLGVGTWRTAVFLGPPLNDDRVDRRDISEYISAMGRFFVNGKQSGGWLVEQVRNGVLREINDELNLPPDADDVERTAAALSRREPDRGRLFAESLRAVDNELKNRRHWPTPQTLEAIQRLTACLSKTTTDPSVPNSPRSFSAKTK